MLSIVAIGPSALIVIIISIIITMLLFICLDTVDSSKGHAVIVVIEGRPTNARGQVVNIVGQIIMSLQRSTFLSLLCTNAFVSGKRQYLAHHGALSATQGIAEAGTNTPWCSTYRLLLLTWYFRIGSVPVPASTVVVSHSQTLIDGRGGGSR